MKSDELISEIVKTSQNHILRAKLLNEFDEFYLNHSQGNRWSALECIEHLNQYFYYYLPEIESQINKSNSERRENFSSGILGNYFAQSIVPKQNMKKMKSPKDKNPKGKILTKSVIEIFIANVEKLTSLMEKSRNLDLEKVKISVSIAKFIRIRLGDALRFVVNHNERHLQQAERALTSDYK